MRLATIQLRTRLDHPAQTVFKWHLFPSAFERLTPPWVQVQVLSREGGPNHIGSRLTLKVKIGPFWRRWVVQHTEFSEDNYFTDVQLDGPFKFWKHTHRVRSVNAYTSEIEDEVQFLPPFSLFKGMIEKKIMKILEWRHERLKRDLDVQSKYAIPPMRILVSGSTGFVGSHLIPFLETAGHHVSRLVRKLEEKEENTVYWDPEHPSLEDFEGFDAVIHLAGKSLASGLWTEKLKKEIFSSRCEYTKHLAQVLSKLKSPPQTFICASAIGIYGNRKGEELTENSSLGEGFLANVCKEWEKATDGLEGIRCIHTRFGMILSQDGGLLKKMMIPFRMGLGAIIGSGTQVMSWIALDDVIYALYHVLHHKEVSGGVNFCAPVPETNASFSRKLAQALNAPLFFRIGEKPLRFLAGEMAEEMLLASQSVKPEKLLNSGYEFLYSRLNLH